MGEKNREGREDGAIHPSERAFLYFPHLPRRLACPNPWLSRPTLIEPPDFREREREIRHRRPDRGRGKGAGNQSVKSTTQQKRRRDNTTKGKREADGPCLFLFANGPEPRRAESTVCGVEPPGPKISNEARRRLSLLFPPLPPLGHPTHQRATKDALATWWGVRGDGRGGGPACPSSMPFFQEWGGLAREETSAPTPPPDSSQLARVLAICLLPVALGPCVSMGRVATGRPSIPPSCTRRPRAALSHHARGHGRTPSHPWSSPLSSFLFPLACPSSTTSILPPSTQATSRDAPLLLPGGGFPHGLRGGFHAPCPCPALRPR